MSGGSYNYLCFAEEVEALLERQQQLQEMADYLAGRGDAADAAAETQTLLLDLRAMQNRIKTMQRRLSEVWRAVEWHHSGDSGQQNIVDALAEYRKGK